MKLSLVLTLTLLGSVSAHVLSEGALEQEVSDELESSILEEGPRTLEPPGLREDRLYRFAFVSQPQTFAEAESMCRRRYQGHLASVHSSSMNKFLHKTAGSRIKQAQVWIGGKTTSSGGRLVSYWTDRTPWNFTFWAGGNPSRSGTTCVVLCTAGGHWRSVNCGTRRAFICQH